MKVNKNILRSGLLIGVCIATGMSCKTDTQNTKGGNKPKVLSAEGHVVTSGIFLQTYETGGTLLPNEEVTIMAEIPGRVTGIFFKEGSKVEKGQLLVQLYDENIRAQIQKLKAQRELQTRTEDRQQSLLKIGGISQQDYETTQTLVKSTDADIAYAEAQLRATKILAPFTGQIGIRNISVGAVVGTSTVITTLQQTNPLKVDFTIPDQHRSTIRQGGNILFTVPGIEDTLSGTIAAIDPGADQVTRTIRVRATIPNTANKLVAGAFARIILPLQSSPDAILIPSQSVIPTTRDKLVAIVKNGKAELAKVTLGARTAGEVEVLSGLTPGDTILTTGILQVKQGMEVTVNKLM